MEYYQKRIRDLREDADKTQSEIAEMLGTSVPIACLPHRLVIEIVGEEP